MNTDKHGSLETKTHFLNVDLFLTSRRDLTPLIAAVGKKVHVLGQGRHGGRHWANFEVPFQPRGPAEAIRRFARVVVGLRGSAKALWLKASVKNLDVGIQSGTKVGATVPFDGAVLEKIRRIGAKLVITIYHADRSRAGRLPEI